MTTSSVPGIAYPRDLAGLAADLAGLGIVPLGRKVPYILAQSAVPVCLAPNGTVATDGIVTLGTALPTVYSGGIWLRLPAGAVSGGAAGLYWAVMASTTQGQVYTAFVDTASPFTPYIPTGLVAAIGSNAAYTQTTAVNITLTNITLPGGAMGASGALRISRAILATPNANNKAADVRVAGVIWHNSNPVSVATVTYTSRHINRASQSLQSNTRYNISDGQSSASINSSQWTGVDTSADTALTHTAQIATATDYIILEGFTIEVLPS